MYLGVDLKKLTVKLIQHLYDNSNTDSSNITKKMTILDLDTINFSVICDCINIT